MPQVSGKLQFCNTALVGTVIEAQSPPRSNRYQHIEKGKFSNTSIGTMPRMLLAPISQDT